MGYDFASIYPVFKMVKAELQPVTEPVFSSVTYISIQLRTIYNRAWCTFINFKFTLVFTYLQIYVSTYLWVAISSLYSYHFNVLKELWFGIPVASRMLEIMKLHHSISPFLKQLSLLLSGWYTASFISLVSCQKRIVPCVLGCKLLVIL